MLGDIIRFLAIGGVIMVTLFSPYRLLKIIAITTLSISLILQYTPALADIVPDAIPFGIQLTIVAVIAFATAQGNGFARP